MACCLSLLFTGSFVTIDKLEGHPGNLSFIQKIFTILLSCSSFYFLAQHHQKVDSQTSACPHPSGKHSQPCFTVCDVQALADEHEAALGAGSPEARIAHQQEIALGARGMTSQSL